MSLEQKLKCAVYSDTKKICREAGVYLDMEFESSALDVIAELTWKKLQSFAHDLEAFQNFRHAKRSMINADDVRLLVRNNDSLKELVDAKLKETSKNKAEAKAGKRKRKEPAASAD